MVEHNDDFGSSPPPPSPEGSPGEPTPELAGEAPAALEMHEAAFEHPHAAPTTVDEGPKHPVFPMLLGAAMVLTLVIAWGVNMSKNEEPAPSSGTATPSTATAATPAASPATPEPGAGDKALPATVDSLKGDLKALQDKIESLPKPAPSPDLGPINSKVAELSKQTEAVADLPKKVDDLNERVGGLDKSIAALKEEIGALKGEVKKTEAAPALEASKPEDVNVSDAAFGQGVELFKAGKYKEASDAFRKLTEANPSDARVWYYAALSRGSATKDWQGETTRLVEKAVEREKAGTPDSAKIDAAFRELNPAFKPWFDAYRKMAKSR